MHLFRVLCRCRLESKTDPFVCANRIFTGSQARSVVCGSALVVPVLRCCERLGRRQLPLVASLSGGMHVKVVCKLCWQSVSFSVSAPTFAFKSVPALPDCESVVRKIATSTVTHVTLCLQTCNAKLPPCEANVFASRVESELGSKYHLRE